MPFGQHMSTCLKCGKIFICSDCIDLECPECRQKSYVKANNNTEIKLREDIMLELISIGTKVKIGTDFSINGEIEAICIRGRANTFVTYEVFWFDNSQRKSTWVPKDQLQIVDGSGYINRVGFAK